KITTGSNNQYNEIISCLVDFDGDGLVDFYDPETSEVWLNTGNGFSSIVNNSWKLSNGDPLYEFNYGTKSTQIAGLSDFNGDGLVDFYKIGDTTLKVNTGSGFVSESFSDPIAFHFIRSMDGKDYISGLTDINGDGYPDKWDTNHQGTSQNSVNLGTGNGFQQLVTPWPFDNDTNRMEPMYKVHAPANGRGRFSGLMDFNGDGLPDYYDGSSSEVYLNHGHGFMETPLTADNTISFIPTDWSDTNDKSYATWVDINGDGLIDFYNSDTSKAWINDGITLRINNIDNTNHSVDIEYSALMDNNIYIMEDSSSIAKVHDIAGLWVVKFVEDDDGVGRTKTSYNYTGAKRHTDYGFLGFSKVVSTNEESNMKLETQYVQTYPHIGSVDKSFIKYKGVSQDITLEKTINTWLYTENSITFDSETKSVYWPYLKQSQTVKYELNSPTTEIFNSTVVNTYNSNGTLGNSVEIHTNNYTKTLSYTYYPDTEASDLLIIGKVKKETISVSDPNAPTLTRNKKYYYDNQPDTATSFTKGFLTKEVVEEDETTHNNIIKTTNYTKNTFGKAFYVCNSGHTVDVDNSGNITSYNQMSDRCIQTQFSSINYGRYPDSKVYGNGKRYYTYKYDHKLGLKTKEYDLYNNDRKTEWSYNSYSQLTNILYPDNTSTSIDYLATTGDAAPTSFSWRITTTSSGKPKSTIYYDNQGRVIRTVSKTLDQSKFSIKDVVYDQKGQVEKKSLAYFSDSTPIWHQYFYDEIGRVTKEITPNNKELLYVYGVDSA
ncbi:MAG: hypothetical protein JKY89_05185, partial [Immundisolibacteraceae bacterium]|nr:hypothetical protein [Immundisolibacteraceae bacterium]